MAQKGLKYEYKIISLASGEALVSQLNELGQEGWWVVDVSRKAQPDDHLENSILLVRVV